MNAIDNEPAWRALPPWRSVAEAQSRVLATRWHAIDGETREFHNDTPNDRHILKIILNTSNIRFLAAGKVVHDGMTMAGMLHVTEPGVKASCLFRTPCDVLHLHVPNRFIEECASKIGGHRISSVLSRTTLKRDAIIERLGRALLAVDQIIGALGNQYVDCISTAIVMRLLSSADCAALTDRKVSQLAPWRLKRAIDYFEENLDQPITTSEIASATGLTRMYFAAAFRAATGLRPHEYMLRRRIERAQDMLLRTNMSLAEIALSVGFQSQPHFTGVFHRFVGRPPQAWRRSCENRVHATAPPPFQARTCTH